MLLAEALVEDRYTMDKDRIESIKKTLSPAVYNVCFEAGTEPPFSGKYNKHYENGVYRCVVCKTELFKSDTKFDSGTGWPSFWDAADNRAIVLRPDNTLGTSRIEVLCGKCGSHLGHVFDDGPAPTGKRYCINSVTLDFEGEK